jgi:hypothetical protein
LAINRLVQFQPPNLRLHDNLVKMDVKEVSKLFSASWLQYADSVAQYEDFVFPIPFIPEISVIDFVGSVFVALFLRSIIDYKIHWFRLLAVTWLLSVGMGGT